MPDPCTGWSLHPRRSRAKSHSPSHSHSNSQGVLTRLESWLVALLPPRDATANSLLFQRLPPEIRRQILIYAFGGWTVHIGLSSQSVKKRFGRSTLQWTWKGCFCHEKPVSWANPPHFERRRRAWFDDRCFEKSCQASKCFLPFECRVGALGWLLSCRQAYSEGIDVLYATNTMHLHGFVLLRQLPELLSRPRLESIVRVELTWHLNPWYEPDPDQLVEEPLRAGPSDRKIPSMRAFVSTAEALPDILPNVKYLYISLVGGLIPSSLSVNSPQTYHTTEALLQVLDRSVRRLHRLVQCRVALPTSCFHMWKFKIPHIWEDAFRDSLDLGGVFRELLPEPGLDGVEGSQGIKGYWVCHGKWDLPQHFMAMAWIL